MENPATPELAEPISLQGAEAFCLEPAERSASELVESDVPVLTYQGLELDRFQAEAIAHVKANRSVLVTAPTGTGKTIIADYVVERALLQGREVVYTAPIKALSNQKYRDYTRLYGKSNIGLITGDLVINQDARVRIMTTEILRNILLQEGQSARLSHVIIDEAHFLDDEERGTVWEELLIYLPRQVRIVALSATLPNVDEFAEWLSLVRDEEIAVVKETSRAVPLKILVANRQAGILTPKMFVKAHAEFLEHRVKEKAAGRLERGGGRFERSAENYGRGGRYSEDSRRDRRSFRRGDSSANQASTTMTRHLDMVELVRPDYMPVLYFVFSRRQTEMFAREAARRIRGSLLSIPVQREVEAYLDRFETQNPDVLTPDHRRMYESGIAFHHAGLHVALKALVEELYEQKLIQLLYCTSTFALGINMPARTVIFDSLRKFNGSAVVPLTVRQFLQKAGRAGRRGMDEVGYVIIREDFEHFKQDNPLLSLYQKGQHEQIESAFNLSFSSVVNLLRQHSEAEIQTILDRSFLNFRNRKALLREREQLEQLEVRISEMERGQRGESHKDRPRDNLKRWRKQARRLDYRLKEQEGALLANFKEKEDFLKLSGYLNDDGSFNAGANALLHIQISEILVTEILLEGIFEEADGDELFGILTAVVHELPRSVTSRLPLRGRWAYFRERLRGVKSSEVVVQGSALMGCPVEFSPELMPFGHMWAQGKSLSELMLRLNSDIDVSGDLVGAFRRAKDLAGQLRTVYREDDFMASKLADLIKRVSRDEVEVID